MTSPAAQMYGQRCCAPRPSQKWEYRVELLSKGRYRARLAASAADVAAALALRQKGFRNGATGDSDAFDAMSEHVLVEACGMPVACFRLMRFASGAMIGDGYAGQRYDLGRLAALAVPMVEMGRFCLLPGCNDPDILRLAWAALTRIVDAEGAGVLFGCSSFAGTDPEPYRDTLALLAARHLVPPSLRPGVKAPETDAFAQRLAGVTPDPSRALPGLPPLLRSYLAMGGRVSDHAVIDRDLNTFHVFTALEIVAVPEPRARALRMLSG